MLKFKFVGNILKLISLKYGQHIVFYNLLQRRIKNRLCVTVIIAYLHMISFLKVIFGNKIVVAKLRV